MQKAHSSHGLFVPQTAAFLKLKKLKKLKKIGIKLKKVLAKKNRIIYNT